MRRFDTLMSKTHGCVNTCYLVFTQTCMMTYIDQIILVCQISCSMSLSYNMLVAENQVVAEANPKLWVAKKTSMWLEKNQRRVCVLHACKLLGATIGSSAPPLVVHVTWCRGVALVWQLLKCWSEHKPCCSKLCRSGRHFECTGKSISSADEYG